MTSIHFGASGPRPVMFGTLPRYVDSDHKLSRLAALQSLTVEATGNPRQKKITAPGWQGPITMTESDTAYTFESVTPRFTIVYNKTGHATIDEGTGLQKLINTDLRAVNDFFIHVTRP